MLSGHSLREVFGGRDGWIFAVPPGTGFDLVEGRLYTPTGVIFVRSHASRRWYEAEMSSDIAATIVDGTGERH